MAKRIREAVFTHIDVAGDRKNVTETLFRIFASSHVTYSGHFRIDCVLARDKLVLTSKRKI